LASYELDRSLRRGDASNWGPTAGFEIEIFLSIMPSKMAHVESQSEHID